MLKEIRDYCIKHLDELTSEFIKNCEENGIKVILCDEKKAKDYLKNIDGVIAKTTWSDELGLDIFRTDLGEYISWKLGLERRNPILPLEGYHLEIILKAFKCKTPEELVEKVKKEIQEKIENSQIGITGANALVSDGSIYLVENEGNIARIITREKLIVIAENTKIYPSHEWAIKAVLEQIKNSTEQKITSYIHIVGGPSRSADLPNYPITGVHGTKEIEILLIDKRNHPYLEIFKCINCGKCARVCPVFKFKTFGGAKLGPKGIIMHELYDEVYLCTLCGRCKRNCPVEIDIPSLILKMRNKAEKGEANELVRKSIISSTSDDLFYCC
jgi:L-lactate dehydrogenase complex protein LldG